MRKGQKMSEASKIKLSKSRIGIFPSVETKKKMSLAKIGKPTWNKGKTNIYSKEALDKMRLSHIGQKPYKMTDEIRKKLSIAKKGIKLSDEHKINMSKCRIGKRTGDKSPSWKGGLTPENQKIRHSIELKLWRDSIFARDNWTCQKCHRRGNDIRAHHIKNFAQFPELRTSIENGITFCKKCHKDFHDKYGYKNNNNDQIEEFNI